MSVDLQSLVAKIGISPTEIAKIVEESLSRRDNQRKAGHKEKAEEILSTLKEKFVKAAEMLHPSVVVMSLVRGRDYALISKNPSPQDLENIGGLVFNALKDAGFKPSICRIPDSFCPVSSSPYGEYEISVSINY